MDYEEHNITDPGFYAYGRPENADYLRVAIKQVEKSREESNWAGATLMGWVQRGLFFYSRRSCRLEWSLMGGVEVE